MWEKIDVKPLSLFSRDMTYAWKYTNFLYSRTFDMPYYLLLNMFQTFVRDLCVVIILPVSFDIRWMFWMNERIYYVGIVKNTRIRRQEYHFLYQKYTFYTNEYSRLLWSLHSKQMLKRKLLFPYIYVLSLRY